ncbi:hypothetical protein BZA70DRAFT_268638 [Myxozyma melibiosi]|uniref:BZIP domain-containing protein n=1 Tax=Myxozyma melibiosi TaxID=54550 RepID=A0ABR1F529_9ASCO
MPPARSSRASKTSNPTTAAAAGQSVKESGAKSSSSPSDSQRAARKRAQNRISQQCFRERQLAHRRQLQSFIDAMKGTPADGVSPSLLTSYVDLVEENQKLRDSLLRTRKKLLSLANSASALAEDEIFQLILAPRGAQEKRSTQVQQQAHQIPSTASSIDGISLDDTDLTDLSKSQQNSERFLDHQNSEILLSDIASAVKATGFASANGAAMHSSIDSGPQSATPINDGLLSIMDGHSLELPSFDSHGLHIFQSPNDDVTRYTASGGFRAAGSSPIDVEMFNLRFLSPPTDPCMPDLTHNGQLPAECAINVSSADILVQNHSISSEMFAASVEEAGVIYLASLCGFRLNEPRSEHVKQISDPIEALKAEYLSVVDTQAVHDVAKIAINLITSYGGLRSYVYGVGGNEIMESIMRWRLCPSLAFRRAIPEPFCPTAVQFLSPRHSLLIDFIDWGTIRDQLILRAGTYDLDTTLRELFLNTVVEIDSLKVAINILDLFKTKIYPNDPTLRHLAEAETSYALKASVGRETELQNHDLLLDTLIHELTLRMKNSVSSPEVASLGAGCGFQRPIFGAEKVFQKSPLAEQYYTSDQRRLWKLNKDYSASCVMLDCTSVKSKYTMVAGGQVMGI